MSYMTAHTLENIFQVLDICQTASTCIDVCIDQTWLSLLVKFKNKNEGFHLQRG